MKEYLTGQNRFILGIRETMPEPSQYEDEFLIVPVKSNLPEWLIVNSAKDDDIVNLQETFKEVVFQKVLVHTDGVSFQAWFCLMDKRIYI